MWFNTIYFIPPLKTAINGEKPLVKTVNFGSSFEEWQLKPCEGPVTLPK